MRWWGLALWMIGSACQVSPKFAGLDQEIRSIKLDEQVELMTLPNGLRVAIVPDARTNLVTIDVRYEVGAADDPPGRAGMAHYAEHVMWEAGVRGGPSAGSLADATLSSNASTTHSSTSFTSIALDVDLDRALEIEARRLEIPCITLREELLVRERDVVIEELKERTGRTPAMDGLAAAVWGVNHPYGRSAGGAEFAAAPSTELCAFVSGHYVPHAMTLVVTGNVPRDAGDRIAARFGNVPAREAPPRAVLAPLPRAQRQPIAVPGLARPAVLVVLPVLPEGGADDGLVEIAALQARALLSYAGLPTGDAFVLGDHRARVIVAHVEVDEVSELDETARAMTRALRPSSKLDLADVVRERRNAFALEFDRLWDRGRRIADQVATTGHALQYRRLEQLDAVSADDVALLLRGRTARIVKLVPAPGGALGRISSLTTQLHRLDVSRSPVDASAATAPLSLPTRRVARTLEDYRLANGLRVVLAPDAHSIAIDARLVFPIGLRSDPVSQPRRSEWAAYLLRPADGWSEGAYEHRLVSWYHRAVGNRPQVDVDSRSTTFRTAGFGAFADWHVWNIAWTVLHGSYPPALDQLRRHGSTKIRPRLARPPHPLRILDRLLGDERDSERELSWVRRRELEDFRRAAYRPTGATLIVSGQFSALAMRKEIETLFGSWRPPDTTAAPIMPPRPAPPRTPRYFAIDDPSAIAMQLVLAYVPGRPQTEEPHDRAARETLSAILDDRMRVVREGLGVSYGIRGAVDANVIQIMGSVDSAHVRQALAVIELELSRLRIPGPELAADFARARRLVLGRALADPSGASEHARSLERSVLHGTALDDSVQLIDAIRTLALEDIARTSADLDPARRIVILRGTRSSVEAAFSALGIDRSHVEWALPE